MCTTSKLRKDLSSKDLILDLVESLHIDDRYPADDVVNKIDAILEKALEEANIPDPDDFVEWADADRWLQENEVVRMDDIKDFAEKGEIEDLVSTDDLDEYLKNDELDDALDTLDVAVGHDLKQFEPARDLVKRGFFGRLKWLFTGR